MKMPVFFKIGHDPNNHILWQVLPFKHLHYLYICDIIRDNQSRVLPGQFCRNYRYILIYSNNTHFKVQNVYPIFTPELS